MKTITLRNDFHNTKARVRAELLEFKALEYDPPRKVVAAILTESQYKRAKRKLCGMSDCKCETLRGPQEHEGKILEIEVLRDPKNL